MLSSINTPATPEESEIASIALSQVILEEKIQDYKIQKSAARRKAQVETALSLIEDWAVALFCVCCVSAVVIPQINNAIDKTLLLPNSSASSKSTTQNNSATKQVTPEAIAKAAIARAERGEHFAPGIEAQCANFVRDVALKLGINLPVTQQPIDGVMPTGPALANGLAGRDMGEVISSIEDLKPGDLVFFQNTYGNWPPGTITHVAWATGNKMMVDRGTGSAPVHHRPIWPKSFKVGLRLKPSLLVKSSPQ